MAMDKKQTQIITLMVIGVIFNGYSAVKAGKTIVKDVGGGFIATALLLALAEGVPSIAEALAGAFMVTSVLTAGVTKDGAGGLITDLTSFVTNQPANPADGNSVTGTGATPDPGSPAPPATAAPNNPSSVPPGHDTPSTPSAGTGPSGRSRLDSLPS